MDIYVPAWWVWVSGIYFFLSIIWNIGLVFASIKVYQKVIPVIQESQIQVRRITNQAKSVAMRASNTADIVHAQTQHLLANADSAGSALTRQARTVGAALTGVLMAARVVNFVRRII
jgi:CHASE3 domain sensor protein